MRHRLVERDVFEEFDPGEKHADGDEVIVGLGQGRQECEVRELVRLIQEILELALDVEDGVHVEPDANAGDDQDHAVQDVPHAHEIGDLVLLDLQGFLHHVVEDKPDKDQLCCHDKMIPGADISQQIHGSEVGRAHHPAGGRELEGELDDAEQVDVGVVDGEVHRDEPGAPANPESFLQLLDDRLGLVLERVEILVGSTASIGD